MTAFSSSKERWEQAWLEDLDVLQTLRSSGDDPTAPREIDVSFKGPSKALASLEASCGDYGFAVQRFEEDEDGEPWLFLVRTQTSDDEAMRDLTATYLQIEDRFGVKSDGWGCLASNHHGPISNENPA